MATLRIHQHPGSAPDRHRIEIEAEGHDRMRQSASVELAFALSPQEQEDIRWYLEDYLEYPHEPAPEIAKDIEQRMAALGKRLAEGIFRASEEARDVWKAIEPHLASARIEIATGVAEAAAIPWELIADPRDGRPLALTARSFVRMPRAAATALQPQSEAGKVRILLVICRPGGGQDVPFRSVASLLVRRLNEEARDAFDLDVLRPPTYEALATVLREANERVRPYHIVHFDGHGVYADPDTLTGAGEVLSSLKYDAGTTGRLGQLLFENPAHKHNAKFVDGMALGGLLKEAQVSLLVLNACQSAMASAAAPAQQAAPDARQELAAYGSLAQAVVDAGAAGVVAMRYSVYVVTAAQFVGELYATLAAGRTLGEAVARARKHLADKPERSVGQEPRPLQDWCVPVAWERAGLRLWPEKKADEPIAITLGRSAEAAGIDPKLPKTPDVGFFGRDETLLALDRAFDQHKIVLLHAYAGAGKTATAAEFARWFRLTGGIDGPVLFSSFERYLPLARVLDKVGETFGDKLEQAGVQWHAINERQRRALALDVLRQVPVLWVWDNVEPVTGFPADSESAWSTGEQQELLDFLRDARDTQAKFLLTSRRDERAWLRDLPVRIEMPAMPMRDRVPFASAIAARHGKRLAQFPDLTPLLAFTRGNPLTILVTVGEALRAGIATRAALDAFVAKLRAGEPAFEDEEGEGRDRSLGASLSYGFATAFNENERKILALLYLFQGFVDVDALRWMGRPETEWCLEAVRGLSRELGIALLDHAVEVGLLNSYGGGAYGIHPALPWYFRALFERHWPESGEGESSALRARRAFVEAVGVLGDYYFRQYDSGNRAVLAAVAAEEDNLMAAWRLTRASGWWRGVTASMSGLDTLYNATGRGSTWRRLVETVIPEFVDPATDGPLPGREEEWSRITEYRVRIAREDRQWREAERLHRLRLDWDRKRAADALALPPAQWGDDERHRLRTLSVAAHELGEIQRGQEDPACVDAYKESLDLAERIGDRPAQATCAYNLGRAYQLPSLRDMDQAERWNRTSLDLRDPRDGLGLARCLNQLGNVAYARYVSTLPAAAQLVARDPGMTMTSLPELLGHLDSARDFNIKALDLLPETAVADRAVTHNALGAIYHADGDVDRALRHYRKSIGYEEQRGNLYRAGITRYNIVLLLRGAGRFAEALAYAEAALANYQTYGDSAVEMIEKTQQAIAEIKQALQQQPGNTP